MQYIVFEEDRKPTENCRHYRYV